MGWIGCVRFENFDATSWLELLHYFGPFWTEFRKATKHPECNQIVRNAPKCQIKVQWGGLGAFVEKNSEATSWHKLLHYIGPFCTEFCKATKRS